MNIYENIMKLKNGGYNLKTKIGTMVKKNFSKKEIDASEILKDIQENHNHSWYQELYERNKDSLDDTALIYRDNKITYGEMFENMMAYFKSLSTMGVKKGDEIPICISNTPEFVYILGAISLLGCKANVFSNHVDKEYTKNLINDCNSNIAFIEDDKYEDLEEILKDTHIDKIIMPSITSSLKNGNPYKEIDDMFGGLIDTTSINKKKNNKIILLNEFLNYGENKNINPENNVTLDDEFTITYSSGTTSNKPKPIVHTVRSFITIGRCHDPEIQKTASMKKMTVEAIIPPYSNTDIISSISDALMQGSKLALEPKYDKEQFIYSLLINKPTYIVATTSYWINCMKKILYDPKFKNVELSSLLIPFAVGEGLTANEEKFLNKGLRKAKAGKKSIPLPVSPVCMCVAGGDCEHGGIFWLIFRNLQNKKPDHLLKDEPHGMRTFPMVETAILDENGNHLPPNTYGRLVANSPCNMKGYKNRPKETAEFFIKDSNGKVYGDCNVYAKKDEKGYVTMKGRIPKKDEVVPSFIIEDAILKDTKNILSCNVIETKEGYFVAHIEFQPDKKKSKTQVLNSTYLRCEKLLGEKITENLFFRIHGFNESFELTGSGKRNTTVLKEEGMNKSIKLTRNGNEYKFENAEEYLENKATEKLFYQEEQKNSVNKENIVKFM